MLYLHWDERIFFYGMANMNIETKILFIKSPKEHLIGL